MDSSIPQLPRSLAAMDRLEKALQRLERAAEHGNGDLFAEREQAADKEQSARLEAAMAAAETRLADVIGRLRQILGD